MATTEPGPFAGGWGTLRAATGAWEVRAGAQDGGPEELTAAAHSACFAMALALRLGDHGVAADDLSVTAVVTLDEIDGRSNVTSSALRVSGRVPDVDRAGFHAAVDEAARLCQASDLFDGTKVSVHTEFDPVLRSE